MMRQSLRHNVFGIFCLVLILFFCGLGPARATATMPTDCTGAFYSNTLACPSSDHCFTALQSLGFATNSIYGSGVYPSGSYSQCAFTTATPTCTSPATLNAAATACVTPTPTCTSPQVLNAAGTVCETPAAPSNASIQALTASITNAAGAMTSITAMTPFSLSYADALTYVYAFVTLLGVGFVFRSLIRVLKDDHVPSDIP